MWYRIGTIAVTQGSATVSGTGTAWVENVRVGDGLQGPDGRLYEITNIASNTSLSIDPPYIGANAAGQGYWIVPVQGYIKKLADRAAQLIDGVGGIQDEIDQLGDDVDQLGDDVDTIAQAVDSKEPVIAAGAGSQYFRGDKVWSGLREDVMALLLTGLPAPTNSPIAAADALLASLAKLQGQISATRGGNTGQFIRGNGTLQNIVGTVADTSGIPSGAIIESGSNANGSYVKFADGTLICHSPGFNRSTTVAWSGDPIRISTIISWTYPVQFVGALPVSTWGQVSAGTGPAARWACQYQTTLTRSSAYIIGANSENETPEYRGTAIGRWKA